MIGETRLSGVKTKSLCLNIVFQINGIARDFIMTDLLLHDGVMYFVTIISCNGAQMCSSTTSSGILVDSTPPSRGKYCYPVFI